jgi:hypothetical protein
VTILSAWLNLSNIDIDNRSLIEITLVAVMRRAYFEGYSSARVPNDVSFEAAAENARLRFPRPRRRKARGRNMSK